MAPMSFDPTDDDFGVSPWLYPGRPAHTSGVLTGDRFVALDASPDGLEAVLRGTGEAPLSQRTIVVAIGSNASPAVMHRKFSTRSVSTTIPFLTGTVTNIAVGHSAHVSRPGYVPAAPFHSPGSCTPVVASLLDRAQLRALDETEPTYTRVEMERDRSRLTLDRAKAPAVYALYVSRRGLLALDGRHPTPLTTQDEVLPLLYQYMTSDSRGHDLQRVMRRLARDESLRELVRSRMRAAGLVAPSGLGGEDAEIGAS